MSELIKNKWGLSKMVIIAILGVIVLIILGLVMILFSSGGNPPPKNITLTIWGIWDDTTDLESVIQSYQTAHPYITINYSKKRFEEYETVLFEGWARGTGPDIYALPNSWLSKYKDNDITPLPASTKVAYYTTKKVLFSTETEIAYKTENSITANDLKRNFANVVYGDVIFNGQIYGLPLSLDTLLMYYNRKLLNQANLASPPQTWADFTGAASKIALVDEQNNILQAGAAMGTANNIDNANDIVALLMLQNGTAMATGGKIAFHQPSAVDPTYFPGAEAVRFYADFAMPLKSTYTWNEEMPNALDYFASGKLGFYFGYLYEKADIDAKNQGVDYDIAAFPQINLQNKINYANYMVYTVAKNSAHADEAWNFLQYAAGENGAPQYLEATKQVGALLSSINSQLNDPALGVPAQQALTSQSWYHGRNPKNAEAYFTEMIASSLTGYSSIKEILTNTAKKIEAEY